MDFDKIKTAKVYNQARSLPPETWAQWRKILRQAVPRRQIKTIVDLGCGTGRFLTFLQTTFSAKVTGVDPSKKMLAEAKKMARGKKNISLKKGSAEQIPLGNNTADMVFISLAFHHFNNLPKALAEVRRILIPGGFAVIRQPTKQSSRKDQVLSFFPESKKMAIDLVIGRKDMFRLWQTNGFKKYAHKIVKQKVVGSGEELHRRILLRGAVIFKLIPKKILNSRLRQLKNYYQKFKKPVPFYEMRELFIFQKPQL